MTVETLALRPTTRWTVALTVTLLSGACVEGERPSEAGSIASKEDGAWRAALIEYRNQKDEELKTSGVSPLAHSQYLLSESRETIYLTRKDRIFGLAYFPPVPDAVLMLVKEVDRWYWYDQGLNVICQQDDEPMPNGSPINAPATFLIEGFYVLVHPEDNRFAFLIYDRERPDKKSFEHLHYFPPDDAYVVDARLTKFPEPDEVALMTSQNLKRVFYRYARVEFQLEGKARELTAFKYEISGDDSSMLFVPFEDATTSRESYRGGRFLEIEEPETERFELDFNRSFNPPCAYSPAYDCPIPPEQNRLTIAIRAGEKTYNRREDL